MILKAEDKILISGKQTKVGKSLTLYAKENISLTLKKYFSNFISADVLSQKISLILNEISMHIDSSIFIKGNALSNDAYGAFNIANDKLKKEFVDTIESWLTIDQIKSIKFKLINIYLKTLNKHLKVLTSR